MFLIWNLILFFFFFFFLHKQSKIDNIKAKIQATQTKIDIEIAYHTGIEKLSGQFKETGNKVAYMEGKKEKKKKRKKKRKENEREIKSPFFFFFFFF